jgi:hypothetical protein
MATRIVISVGLVVLSLRALPGQDKDAPPANPPVVLVASDIDADGNLVLVGYETVVIQPAGPLGAGGPRRIRVLSKVPLKGVKICGVDGKEVTIEAARKRLGGKDTAILALSWDEPLSPVYRRLFRDDVLVFVFPKTAPTWKGI